MAFGQRQRGRAGAVLEGGQRAAFAGAPLHAAVRRAERGSDRTSSPRCGRYRPLGSDSKVCGRRERRHPAPQYQPIFARRPDRTQRPMNAQTIRLIEESRHPQRWTPVFGSIFSELLKRREKMADEEKEELKSKSLSIISRCLPP